MNNNKHPVMQITLVEVHGSAPRNAGAKMQVWNGGQSGTIGGGELEFRVSRTARDMLQQKNVLPVLLDFALGPVLGQCCGGFVRVLIEPAQKKHPSDTKMAVLTCLKTGKKTLQAANSKRARILVLDENHNASSKLNALDQCCFVLEQPADKAVPVYVFGGGHIGAALIKILQPIDFDLHWIDARSGFAGKDIDDPLLVAETAPGAALFVILTHCHDLDYQLCRCILQKPELAFCGLIGSKTKQKRFVRRLYDDGLSDEQIKQLTCPLGLPGIGGKSPAEIAVSIAAQLLQNKKETN